MSCREKLWVLKKRQSRKKRVSEFRDRKRHRWCQKALGCQKRSLHLGPRLDGQRGASLISQGRSGSEQPSCRRPCLGGGGQPQVHPPQVCGRFQRPMSGKCAHCAALRTKRSQILAGKPALLTCVALHSRGHSLNQRNPFSRGSC